MNGGQIRSFLMLYLQLLRAHRRLPPPLRTLGDSYLKHEFRQFRAEAKSEGEFPRFYGAWLEYLSRVEAEGPRTRGEDLGGRSQLLNEEQVARLQQFRDEVIK